jgi:hypothetical protein
MPQARNLRLLLRLLSPVDRTRLEPLLQAGFPNLFPAVKEEPPGVPLDVYNLALAKFADGLLLEWSISQMGLSRLVGAMDKNYRGMRVAILRCTPPRGGRGVRSLHEIVFCESGGGREPSSSKELALIGADSLMGRAVTRKFSPKVPGTERSERAIVVPIRRRNLMAGCLVASSDFSMTEIHQQLVERYANVFSLLFFEREFYTSDQIALQTFPDLLEQRRLLSRHFHIPLSTPSSYFPPKELFQQVEAFLLGEGLPTEGGELLS